MTVDTSLTRPLTAAHCTALTVITIQSRPTNVNITDGPNCQLNNPPTTGAKVTVVLDSQASALIFYNAYATPTRADTIVRVLNLPCNRSSVIFAAPGLAEPRVFDQRNVPALVCNTRDAEVSNTTATTLRRVALELEGGWGDYGEPDPEGPAEEMAALPDSGRRGWRGRLVRAMAEMDSERGGGTGGLREPGGGRLVVTGNVEGLGPGLPLVVLPMPGTEDYRQQQQQEQQGASQEPEAEAVLQSGSGSESGGGSSTGVAAVGWSIHPDPEGVYAHEEEEGDAVEGEVEGDGAEAGLVVGPGSWLLRAEEKEQEASQPGQQQEQQWRWMGRKSALGGAGGAVLQNGAAALQDAAYGSLPRGQAKPLGEEEEGQGPGRR